MLGIPIRYLLKHPITGMLDLAADPLQVLTTMHDYYVADHESREPQWRYQPDEAWEQHLHDSLGIRWPCDVVSEFWTLWPNVIEELEAQGIQPGPESFQVWNDGDAGLVRAIWCLVRHLKPTNIVETGVAHGVTSRCILEAIERNGDGHLWSIDLPPMERHWRAQVGMAVGNRYRDRWTYIKGSSSRRLTELFAHIGHVELFIHDSLHSEHNVRFEMDSAWPILTPGGALLVDDIDANRGFQSFLQNLSDHRSLIGEAEPLRPDLRRFNQKGLFGIILKRPNTQFRN